MCARTDVEFPPLDRIAYYCAQKYPTDLFPVARPLQNRENVRWVDAIIPVPQKRRGGGGIVINLGGLYVHNLAGVSDDLVNRGVDAYLDLVLFPLVKLLLSSDRKIPAICGNINEEGCRRLRALVPDGVAVGPQSGGAFERILTNADLLISAPGTTTLLQAASIDLPTILLPSRKPEPDSQCTALYEARRRPRGVARLRDQLTRTSSGCACKAWVRSNQLSFFQSMIDACCVEGRHRTRFWR